MGCQHSVPQAAKPHKVSPISKYSPARQQAAEFKFKRSRSGSIDTDISSRLESRDSGRIKPGPTAGSEHVFLDSLDELENQCSKLTRNKPIVITAALKKKLILDHIKGQNPELVLSEEDSKMVQKTTAEAAFVPALPVVEDLSSSGDFSIDLIKMLDLIDLPANPEPLNEPMPEVDPEYVHIERGVTTSCFAVQPDSWYTAPRPFLRIQIIEFRWK